MALAAAAIRDPGASILAERRLQGALPPPERIESELELAQLIRFAANPAKHFAQTRLGLRLEIEDEDPATDEEPLELNYLEQWQLKDGLFDLRRGELDEGDAEWLVRARGLLPPSNLGTTEHRRGAVQVATLRQALVPYAEHLDAPPTLVDIDVLGIRVTGEVAGFLPSPAEKAPIGTGGTQNAGSPGFLWWRIGRIREKDRIEVWLRLLALTCATGERLTAHVVGVTNVAQEETFEGPEPSEAQAMLEKWTEAWRDGASEPLPLFPRASWAWAETQDESKTWGAWAGGNWPESQDEYLRLLCPLGPETKGFHDVADTLLGPLFESRA